MESFFYCFIYLLAVVGAIDVVMSLIKVYSKQFLFKKKKRKRKAPSAKPVQNP